MSRSAPGSDVLALTALSHTRAGFGSVAFNHVRAAHRCAAIDSRDVCQIGAAFRSGAVYSWYVVSVPGFIQQATPATQVTTILALFNVTLPALINITAAPLSGWVFDTVGAYWLYALCATNSKLPKII